MSSLLTEIGKDYIKLAVAEKKKGKIFFCKEETFSLPRLCENGALRLSGEAAEVFALYRKKNKVRAKNVTALLRSGETIAKLVKLGNVPPDEAAAAVENNIEGYFPIDRGVYASGYKIISGSTLLLAALPAALLWDYINFFASIGLRLVRNDSVAALVSSMGAGLKSGAVVWQETEALYISYFDAQLMQSLRRIPVEEISDALPELRRLESYYGLHSALEKVIFIFDDMDEIAEYFSELGVETEVIRDEYALIGRLLT